MCRQDVDDQISNVYRVSILSSSTFLLPLESISHLDWTQETIDFLLSRQCRFLCPGQWLISCWKREGFQRWEKLSSSKRSLTREVLSWNVREQPAADYLFFVLGCWLSTFVPIDLTCEGDCRWEDPIWKGKLYGSSNRQTPSRTSSPSAPSKKHQ